MTGQPDSPTLTLLRLHTHFRVPLLQNNGILEQLLLEIGSLQRSGLKDSEWHAANGIPAVGRLPSRRGEGRGRRPVVALALVAARPHRAEVRGTSSHLHPPRPASPVAVGESDSKSFPSLLSRHPT